MIDSSGQVKPYSYSEQIALRHHSKLQVVVAKIAPKGKASRSFASAEAIGNLGG
jgi:hypothetical protein